MTQLSAFNLPAIGVLLHGLRTCGENLVRRLCLQREENAGEASVRDPGTDLGTDLDLDLDLDHDHDLDHEHDHDADGETGRRLPPLHRADSRRELESARMRLFVLTGQYWRGS